MALTRLAHELIAQHFAHDERTMDCAVDATCGNGHDTEFLCRLGFSEVVGFDTQIHAIDATRHRLRSAGLSNFVLHCKNHTELSATVTRPVDCVMFNFGYLPHGDKNITTVSESSVRAVDQALRILSVDGIISLLCYPGHEEGARETQSIEKYLTSLPELWQVSEHRSRSENPAAPRLFIVQSLDLASGQPLNQ